MRKAIVILLSFVLIFGFFAACGNSEQEQEATIIIEETQPLEVSEDLEVSGDLEISENSEEFEVIEDSEDLSREIEDFITDTSIPATVHDDLTSEHITIEYGEPYIVKNNHEPLFAYIRFPQAGNSADILIEEWADGVYQSAHDEIAALLENNAEAQGEINVQFNSYLVHDRYAGVIEEGMFSTSAMAHPVSIIKTFNIDTESGVALNNTDILDYSQLDNILALLLDKIILEYPEISETVGNMDESWLEHMYLHHSGVIVILERATVLPAYLGDIKITLPYDELDTAFILWNETPEPVPQPEPPPVIIIPDIPPQSGEIDPSLPMVALTFDDGPSKYTAQILDLLESYGVRATFCVVGNLVDSRSDTVKRAADLGNEIIGHSWSHRDLSKLSSEEIRQDLTDTASVIESVTGTFPMLYRPPYGATSQTLKDTSAELGLALINWSVDTLDWSSRNADAVYAAVVQDVHNRAIILCHDLYESTAVAMERVIPFLISEGYQLVTVSELMYYSEITLQAGTVYYSGN